MLTTLFPDSVIVEVAGPGDYEAPLHPEEATLGRSMVASRIREFAAGRACTRRALARLGLEGVPLLRGRRGEPLWPGGIVGSITHCPGLAAAAVGRSSEIAGLGLDAEPAGRIDLATVEEIVTPVERRDLPGWFEAEDWAGIAFVTKEAIFKAVWPSLRQEFGFHQVAVTGVAGQRLEVRAQADAPDGLAPLLKRIQLRFARHEGLLAAGATLLTNSLGSS